MLDLLTDVLAVVNLIQQADSRPGLAHQYIEEISPIITRIEYAVVERERRDEPGPVTNIFFPSVDLCVRHKSSPSRCLLEAFQLVVGLKIIKNRSRNAERGLMMQGIANCATFETTIGGNKPRLDLDEPYYDKLFELAQLYTTNLPQDAVSLGDRDAKAATEICL